MMRRTVSAVLAIVLLLVAGVSPANAAAQTWQFKFKGLDAFAYFYSVDDSGCVITDVVVYVVDGRVKTGPGRPDADSAGFVLVDRYDQCTDTPLVSAATWPTSRKVNSSSNADRHTRHR